MPLFRTNWATSATLLAGLAFNLYAVDGVVLIDQNHALAGNVTPGDTPGFPVTISVPGSYRLSGNLTVPNADTTAILVTVDNVTIDLNGFSILGPVVCTNFLVTSCSLVGTGKGVDATLTNNIAVLNGQIRGMGADGIAVGLDAAAGIVDNVRAISNGGNGIVAGIVTHSIASNNGGIGIRGSVFDTIVRDNRVSGNVGDGIEGGGLISGNTSGSNGGWGISPTCPSLAIGNTVHFNAAGNLRPPFNSSCVYVTNNAP